MITLLVDEAYAFDYFSILVVKGNTGTIPYSPEVDRCRDFLSCQIPNFKDITGSNEFHSLYLANLKIFNLLEDQDHPADYKAIGDANRQRFLCKQALQKKFFGEEMKAEKKSGRDA